MHPHGIAIDSSGSYVFVGDQGNRKIEKFTIDGKFLLSWGSLGKGDGQFNKPYGIRVDSSGNVYVADSQNSRIQKLDINGVLITKWGLKGTGNGDFLQPEGISVDRSGNTVFVSDTIANNVSEFSG